MLPFCKPFVTICNHMLTICLHQLSFVLAQSQVQQDSGLHKVKWCLQEFFNFLCACGIKTPYGLVICHFLCKTFLFPCFLCLLYPYISVYLHLMYDLTLQMTFLAIVPGKPNMCLQENLVDCADCGGLLFVSMQNAKLFVATFSNKHLTAFTSNPI